MVVIGLAEEEIFSFKFVTWPNVVIWSGSHVTLWVSSDHYKSLSYQVWWSQALHKKIYFIFSLSRDLTWIRGQRFTWQCRWVYLIISDYPAKFADYRPFIRGDIKLSVCHVTSRDYLVRGSCNIIRWVSAIISPAKFWCHRPYRRGDILFLTDHVTSCDQVVNEFCGIMGRCLSS